MNTLSWRGLSIWLICATFFSYEFLLRTILGTFQHPIMSDLELTPFRFALLSTTAYMVIFSAMQMPVGIIAERFGLKKTLGMAVVICALASFAFAFSYQLKWAFLMRILMGFGSAFGFICLLIAVYEWMPERYYGLFIGLSQFIGTLGPMAAAGPMEYLAESSSVHWRSIFMGLGIAGSVLALLVILFVANKPKDVSNFRVIHKPRPLLASLKKLLMQKQTWIIALYSAMVYFTLDYLSENEGKAFLQLHGFSSQFGASMITVGWIGYAVGCPVLGFISDMTRRRKPVLVFAALCAVVSVAFIVYSPINAWVLTAAFFTLGVGCSGQSVGFAIMAEQCHNYYIAIGLGFNNAMMMFLASLNAPMLGLILDGLQVEGTLTLQDYQYTFSVIMAMVIAGLLISIFFIKETYCRPTKGFTVLKPKSHTISA